MCVFVSLNGVCVSVRQVGLTRWVVEFKPQAASLLACMDRREEGRGEGGNPQVKEVPTYVGAMNQRGGQQGLHSMAPTEQRDKPGTFFCI